jgi:hypothetical protein
LARSSSEAARSLSTAAANKVWDSADGRRGIKNTHIHTYTKETPGYQVDSGFKFLMRQIPTLN